MPALADGDRLLYDIGILIARARKLVWTAAARELEAQGFSILTWGVLAYLVRSGPATQREIAEAIGQHPASISRLVSELEDQALVRRGRDDEDRRRARVEITRSGKALCRAARPHVIGAIRSALRPISVPEQRTLRTLLLKLMPETDLAPERPAAPRKRAPKRN